MGREVTGGAASPRTFLAAKFDEAAARWREQADTDRVAGATSSMSGEHGIPSHVLDTIRAQIWAAAATELRAEAAQEAPAPEGLLRDAAKEGAQALRIAVTMLVRAGVVGRETDRLEESLHRLDRANDAAAPPTPAEPPRPDVSEPTDGEPPEFVVEGDHLRVAEARPPEGLDLDRLAPHLLWAHDGQMVYIAAEGDDAHFVGDAVDAEDAARFVELHNAEVTADGGWKP